MDKNEHEDQTMLPNYHQLSIHYRKADKSSVVFESANVFTQPLVRRNSSLIIPLSSDGHHRQIIDVIYGEHAIASAISAQRARRQVGGGGVDRARHKRID